jgi:hypothetical protein
MKSRCKTRAWTVSLIVTFGILLLNGSAAAELTGGFTKFQNCPYKSNSVTRCLFSITDGGEVVFGDRWVPIVKPVILQAGYNSPTIEKNVEEGFSKLQEPTNGVTLSEASQPVPGGLAGLVNCDEVDNVVLRVGCRVIFENGLTGVDAVVELARPASEIRISENHIAEALGVALKIPVKIRLENPFLGDSCYIGSSNTPISWKLTTGATNPPAGTKPIAGTVGKVEYLEKVRIVQLSDSELVDNAWSMPKAEGCGGPLSFLIDPIVNASSGLPSGAGKNVARLKSTIYTTTSNIVQIVDKENP